MTDTQSPPRFDWTPLLTFSRSHLISELVDTETSLANAIDEVAYLRCCELRDKATDRTPRIEQEAVRDILIEKKWLITRLLDHVHTNGV